MDWVWRFGLQSGRNKDKLAGLGVRTGNRETPILSDAIGWMECRVESSMDAGDRTIYLAEVTDGALTHSEKPLTIQRLLQLAPQEELAAMAAQREHDTEIAARAILKHRAADA